MLVWVLLAGAAGATRRLGDAIGEVATREQDPDEHARASPRGTKRADPASAGGRNGKAEAPTAADASGDGPTAAELPKAPGYLASAAGRA